MGDIFANLQYQPAAGKILENMPDLRVSDIFGEHSAGRKPPLLFWGCIVPAKGSFWSFWVHNLPSWFFRAYRQVHWCASLFCGTTPEQRKIPQNRPNSRFFDGFGGRSGGRNPPHPCFGGRESKGKRNSWRKSSIGRYTGVQHCSAAPAQSRRKYPKIGQISGFMIFLDRHRAGETPPPYFGAVVTKTIGHSPRKTSF